MVSSFINPRQIINGHLELTRDALVADFGCGSGEWAVALAEMCEDGKIYAIDLLDEPLSVVRRKARDKNLQNIEIVKADVEKKITRLLANSLNLVLMTNLLFQVEDKKPVLVEAKRVLKPGGRLLVIDWSPEAAIGPDKKLSPQELKELAKAEGFLQKSEFDAGGFHYGLIFEKKFH